MVLVTITALETKISSEWLEMPSTWQLQEASAVPKSRGMACPRRLPRAYAYCILGCGRSLITASPWPAVLWCMVDTVGTVGMSLKYAASGQGGW